MTSGNVIDIDFTRGLGVVDPTLCYLNAQALGEKLLGRLGGISLDSGSSVT